MKYPQLKVSIPEPCHENWTKMTPTTKGKFCSVCTKDVVDFTSKSDEEIVKYNLKYKNVCGRFYSSQLDRKLIISRKERNHWLSYAASLLFPFALFSQEVKSEFQKLPKIEQINTSTFTSLNIGSLHKQGKIAPTIQNDSITVKGVITDDTGLPLLGASIVIKGTTTGKTADFDGNFTIKAKKGDILVYSYVGFESKEIKVANIHQNFNVQLELGGYLGGYTFVGLVASDESEYVSTYAMTSYPKPMTEEEIQQKKERTKNYFAFQKKKWKEKRAARKLARAKRKAEKN